MTKKLYERLYDDSEMLDIPHAVIKRAFDDLDHKDKEIAQDAKQFLLSGGGFWARFTELNITDLYLRYIEGTDE